MPNIPIASAISLRPAGDQNITPDVIFVSKYYADIQRYVVNKNITMRNTDFLLILYIAHGGGTITINGRKEQIKSGIFSFLDMDSFVEIEALSTVVLYFCAFKPELFGIKNDKKCTIDILLRDKNLEYFFCNRNIDPTYHRTYNKKINELMAEMCRESNTPSPAFNHLMRIKLTEFLVRISEEVHDETVGESDAADIVMVRHITEFIKSNFDKKLTYDYLASQAYVSKSKLFATFKDITGQNIGKYIEIVRLERACDMLSQTEKSIFDIMVAVGYHDMKMFCKRFKDFTQSTPSEYRRITSQSGKIGK